VATVQESALARYGFVYDPRNNPPIMDLPQAKPLHGVSKLSDKEIVREHGQWCLARCSSPRHRAEIQAMLDENERRP
jgi:hypothetical protein